MVETQAQLIHHLCRFAEMKNEVGLAPMHFACWNGHIDACQVLFSHKVKLDSQSSADSVAEVILANTLVNAQQCYI